MKRTHLQYHHIACVISGTSLSAQCALNCPPHFYLLISELARCLLSLLKKGDRVAVPMARLLGCRVNDIN